MKLVMVEPRGFCAGVDRAINIVNETLRIVSSPLYVNHEIVHNSHVIDDFKKKGVVFTEDINTVPFGSTFIFNAHGVSPKLVEKAKKKNLNIIDATCPLVNKVHLEVINYIKKGYQIVLIGHANHPEVEGVMGHSSDKIHLVETLNDIQNLPFDKNTKIAYVTQTTLSTSDCNTIIEALKKEFSQIVGPKKSDICYATTNRQLAVQSIASEVEAIIIIGSHNSSNSNRLREVASEAGCDSFLINNIEDIHIQEFKKFNSIAISAGASTPEEIILVIVNFLKKNLPIDKVETFVEKKEQVYFGIPDIKKS